MPIATADPATGQTVRTFEPLTAEQLDARLQCAADAYLRHRRTTFAERQVPRACASKAPRTASYASCGETARSTSAARKTGIVTRNESEACLTPTRS